MSTIYSFLNTHDNHHSDCATPDTRLVVLMTLSTGIEADCLGNSVSMNVAIKPIDRWSRGIHRRLLVELTFESLPQTLSLEMEVGSTPPTVRKTTGHWGPIDDPIRDGIITTISQMSRRRRLQALLDGLKRLQLTPSSPSPPPPSLNVASFTARLMFSSRLAVSLVMFFGTLCLYSQRSNLSVAIICMTNNSAVAGLIDTEKNASPPVPPSEADREIVASDRCPENDTQSSGVSDILNLFICYLTTGRIVGGHRSP
ncbi:unnamed protein product [Protopolystoma xenopodis]|uniref:Uncharacterized protein n=1 Tax=Protopolystoma xenopodis TaxID=117903 RepID=A0A448WEN1_9PLAT|nr:unnamed protein product [Protopolystoma xenopodis]